MGSPKGGPLNKTVQQKHTTEQATVASYDTQPVQYSGSLGGWAGLF